MSENDENSIVDKPHVRLMKECLKPVTIQKQVLG